MPCVNGSAEKVSVVRHTAAFLRPAGDRCRSTSPSSANSHFRSVSEYCSNDRRDAMARAAMATAAATAATAAAAAAAAASSKKSRSKGGPHVDEEVVDGWAQP